MTSLGTLQNGGVVTTQFVIPCNLSIIQQQHLPPQAQTTTFLQKFIKGEPLALGVAQIMIGIMQMLLGGLLWADIFQSGHWTIYSGVTFWGAVLFITSASLSIAAQKKGAPCLVKGSLGMNIISSISAGIGIIIYSFDLAYLIYFYPYNGCHNDDDYNPECTVLSEAYYVSTLRCELPLLRAGILRFLFPANTVIVSGITSLLSCISNFRLKCPTTLLNVQGP